MKIKIHILVVFGVFATIGQIISLTANAQESSATSDLTTASQPKYSRSIIVQTDFEQPIANHELKCKQIPKKLDEVEDSEITWYEIKTNEAGEAVLAVADNKDFTFNCESKSPTTQDYCWYFPYSTQFFDIYDESEKDKPIYLVAQTSPETCNKEFSQTELNNIKKLLPSGTPMPFLNKNLIAEIPTPTPVAIEQLVPEVEEISLWQWFVFKLKSLFRF